MTKIIHNKMADSPVPSASGNRHIVLLVAIALCIFSAACVMPVVAEGHEEHLIDDAEVGWYPWNEGDTTPPDFKYIYLNGNVSITSDWTINSEKHLCLNGYKLDLNKKHIVVNNAGNLSLYDCDDRVWQFNDNDGLWEVLDDGVEGMYSLSGGIITNGNVTGGEGGGGAIYVNGGKFTQWGGNIVGNYPQNGGGGVNIINGGFFYMFGGNITGNKAGGTGGGLESSGTAIIYGGNITHNSGNNGGAICIWNNNGNLTMLNGKVSDNIARGTLGGGIYNDGAKLNIYDGEISNNIIKGANGNGGGVYISDKGAKIFNMGGGKISDNTATQYGGGVYIAGGTFTLSDGKIENNTAQSNGGGVYINGGTSTLSGGEIVNNTAQSNGGGGVYINGGTNTLSGGEIVNNTASSNGGGIYCGYIGQLSISNGKISNNTAKYGGGIYINGQTAFMSGGKVENNTAVYKGGGIFITQKNAEFILSNGNITGNEAKVNSGGGVFVSGGGKFTMTTGNISGNLAKEGGGGVETQGTFIMNGGDIRDNNVVHTASDHGDGGGVCVWSTSGAEFTMNGGNITNNKANYRGGGIYLGGQNSNTTIKRGNITGNSAGVNGGGIYINEYANTRITISGIVVVTDNKKSETNNNIYLLNNRYISIDSEGLTEGSNLYLTSSKSLAAEEEVRITTGGDETQASYFHPDAEGFFSINFKEGDGNIYLRKEAIPDPSFDVVDHSPEHGGNVYTWHGWNHSSYTGPTNSGYYVLTEDVILLGGNWEIPENTQIILCLNGSVLDLSRNQIKVPNSAELIICDCKFGNASHTHYFDRPDGVIKFYNDTTKKTESTPHNYLWVLNNTNTSSPYNVTGGVITNAIIEIGNGGAIIVNGKLTLFSGNLVGNMINQTKDTDGPGGAVFIDSGGNFTMHGGNITGNVAGAGGGGLQVGQSGTFIMHGGNITENYSPRFGGGVTGWSATKWEMHGGQILNNTAGEDGGGVFIERCKFEMFNGLVANNTAGYGGGVCVIDTLNTTTHLSDYFGYFDMYGGTITKNLAYDYGGGFSPFAKYVNESGGYGNITFYNSSVPIIIENNVKWDAPNSTYVTCNVYIASHHITNIRENDVLPAGSYIGVKPSQLLTGEIEVPVSNTTRYENENYFHSDLAGDFEPFYDGDSTTIYLHLKSKHDDNFGRDISHYLNHTDLGENILWYDWNGTDNLIPRASGYYVMTDDITLTKDMLLYGDPELGEDDRVWNITGEVIHICLNGHVLNLNDSRIRVSGKLVINDCNGNHGEHHFTVDDDGMWNLTTSEQYSHTIYGGIITGNTKPINITYEGDKVTVKEYGGAIRTVNGSVFFRQGTIVGNRAGVGGGIYLQGGNLTIENGNITGNMAEIGGGGVEVKKLGRFEMRGGLINNNTVNFTGTGAVRVVQKGGGVCLGVNEQTDSVNFIMSGGVIQNNTVGNPNYPGEGAGVYVDTVGTVTMSNNATVDESNEFYISNIETPISIVGGKFTGGVKNLNRTIDDGKATSDIIVKVNEESYNAGSTPSDMLSNNQVVLGKVPHDLGFRLKASDENRTIYIDYEEPSEDKYSITINDNSNGTIFIDGKDKGAEGKYWVQEAENITVVTNLTEHKYVLCNYTVMEEGGTPVYTHPLSHNKTYMFRNFTMPAANVNVTGIFGLRGDADFDGDVCIVDSACVGIHIIRVSMDNPSVDPLIHEEFEGYACADVDGNGEINVYDLLEINRYLVGYTEYPGADLNWDEVDAVGPETPEPEP